MNYKLNEAKMFADISDGLAIVINSDTGVYFGMNPFTSTIFENIISGASIADICASVMSIEGSPAAFEADLNGFIAELSAKELIIEGNDMVSEASVNEGYAKECNFEISWDEFKDAQELLLADPIHEVKEDEGWAPEMTSLNDDEEDVRRREAKLK